MSILSVLMHKSFVYNISGRGAPKARATGAVAQDPTLSMKKKRNNMAERK